MLVKMVAKKEIERKREGEYEIIKNHVIEIPNENAVDFDKIVIDMLGFDDSWDAYMRFGVSFGFDDGVFCVEVSKFIDNVISYLHDDESDWWDEDDKDWIRDELKKLEPYRGYDIYI